jgi:hypothetical protein
MPINPFGRASHPLRAEEVFAQGEDQPPRADDSMTVTCPDCGREQTLAEAELRPAADPEHVTDYWCENGCRPVVSTGHAPADRTPEGAWRVGDFVVQPLLNSGMGLGH